MRIVGGALSGRRFSGPPGDATRPTAERVREAIASALDARGGIDGRVVLDLWAGTGALAFEALSRGALRATCVEKDRRVAKALAASAEELGLEQRVRVLALAAPSRALDDALSGDTFGLVFADPPYADVAKVVPMLVALSDAGRVADGALVVVEHAHKAPPETSERLPIVATYRYGDTGVTLLRASITAP
jgi:16S rRNA (guanine966-N2)-methyltransferase